MKFITAIQNRVSKLRFPSICVVCYKYHYDTYAVCQSCYVRFKRIGFACRYCAQPLVEKRFSCCKNCQLLRPAFDKVVTSYQYEAPLRQLLHRYKYNRELYLGYFLSKLMLDAIDKKDFKTECLIPVPLHPKKVRERGFNQAVELAKILSKQCHLPYDLNLCKKILHTPAQAGLNISERQRNLTAAFRINTTNYRRVTLIDDVLTTGSTANELAKLLKKQGVVEVSIWCCARASLHH